MTTLQVSQELGEATVFDVRGEGQRLGALWAEGPVVLVFLRHYG